MPQGLGAGDLTARARIRDAAIHLFTERGVEGATIRDIAAEAGVSGGLVRHHFGSKDELRSACDRYAVEQLLSVKEEFASGAAAANPLTVAASQPKTLALLRYLGRALIDGSPSSTTLFDELVEATEQWMATHGPGEVSDRRGYAVLLVALEIGTLTMSEQISRALGTDVMSAEGHLRLAKARLAFYSTPLISGDFAAAARSTIDAMQRSTGDRPRVRSGGGGRS